MKERSLNDRFIELEDRMISVESLTKYGTANDMKFYIFDYNPQDEQAIRKEVKKLKSRNSNSGIYSGNRRLRTKNKPT